MRRSIVFGAMALWLSAGSVALAEESAQGITLSTTRVVYPQTATNGITYTLTNNTDQVYLLQSRVLPSETGEHVEGADERKAPFIVIPPLMRFEPGVAVTLHIRQTDTSLPRGRESLWRLALKTIPTQKNTDGMKDGNPSMVLALQNNLKLFYRPTDMVPLSEEERSKQLQFSQADGYLSVTNPTPYHLTFNELQVDKQPLVLDQQRMLGPYGTQRYRLAKPAAAVSWTLLLDDGAASEPHHRSLR